ncbi:MAG: hypothetical protein U0573_00840 [Phycisphaerales bacterium]|nr:hypothetical protein [Planctomycetota bacterium]
MARNAGFLQFFGLDRCRSIAAATALVAAGTLSAAAPPGSSPVRTNARPSSQPPAVPQEEAPDLRPPVGIIGSFSGDSKEAMAADMEKALRWIRIKKEALPAESIGLLRDDSAVPSLVHLLEDAEQAPAVRGAYADTLVLKSYNIFGDDPGSADAVAALLRLESSEALPVDVRNRALKGLLRQFMVNQQSECGVAILRAATADQKDPHAACAREMIVRAVRQSPDQLDHFAESDVDFVRESAAREIRRLRAMDKSMPYRDIVVVEGWKLAAVEALEANTRQLTAALKTAKDKSSLNQQITEQRKLLAEAKSTPLIDFVAKAVRVYDQAKAEAGEVEEELRRPEPRPASEVLPVVTYTATHEEPVYRDNVLVGTRTVEDGERSIDLGFWATVLAGPANTDRSSFRIRAKENLRHAKETLDQLAPATVEAARARLAQGDSPKKSPSRPTPRNPDSRPPR